MNILVEVEKVIKRKALAEKMDTHPTYLSALTKRKELTTDMERRIIDAVDELMRELDDLLHP